MARGNKFESGNDFDFDDGFGDIPDFSSPKDKSQNKRTPALSLGKEALKGAVGRSGLLDESFIRRTLRSNLPSGYGVALDVADEASSTLRSLYNDSAKELKPLMNDMKRIVGRMEEPLDKYLPKSISKRLNAWSKNIEGSSGGGLDPEAQRDAMIQASIAETLGHSITQDAKREQRDDARSKIREQIDQIRHKDSMGQLNAIRNSVAQLAAYQNNVTANYHRKSLELQYRTFFTLRDIAIEQKRMAEVTTEAFKLLVKNTGLPDYVKMTDSDRLAQATRNRFGKLFDSGIVAARRQFFKTFGDNFKKVIGSRVQNFAQGAGNAISSIGEGADAIQSLQDLQGMGIEGVSPQELLANMSGGMAAQALGGRAVGWLKKRVGTADPNSRLGRAARWGTRQGNRIAYAANGIQGNAKRWANSYENLPGWAGRLPNFLQEMVREAIQMDPGYDRTLQKDKLADMQGPAIFSRQVAKSITEIIPGYLARILREIQITRTGDESTDLLRYDFSGNKFVTHKELRKKVYDGMIDKNNSRSLNDDVDRLIKEIDPGDKLSEGAKRDLRRQLVRDNVRGVSGVAERYQDAFNINSQHSAEIAGHFTDRYSDKNDSTYAARARFSAQHGSLGQNVQIARSKAQDQSNAGMLDLLEDLGLVDQYGNLEIEKIVDLHLDGTNAPGSAASTSRGGKRYGFRRRGGNINRPRGRNTTINNNQTINQGSRQAPQQENYSPNFAGIIEAVKANNNLNVLNEISKTLLRVEAEIQTGVSVHHYRGGPGGADVGAGGIMDRSLRQNLERTKAGLRSGAAKAWAWWKEPGFGAKHWAKRNEYAAQAKKSVVGMWDKIKSKYADMKEVYVDGELVPRLTAFGLKAGMYWDSADVATRKLITRLEDIKGPVYDAAGQEIVSAADAARMFIRTTAGKWTRVSFDWAKTQAQKLFDAATGGTRAAINYGRETLQKVQAYLDAQDVYVAGDMNTPKLRATVMRAKGYRSMHRRDKFILTPADIDGPVVDLTGNQVITDDDIRAGLVDRHGRPLVTGKLRLLQLGKDTIQTVFNKVQNGFNMAKDFLSGKWSGFKNWFKVDGIAFSGGKTIIERLTQIRDLLDTRLPKARKRVIGDVDGDGIREGSYEDEKKKGELHEAHGTSATEAVADAVNGIKSGGKSLYGAIADSVKKLLTKKKKKGDGDESSGNGLIDKVEEYGGLAGTFLGMIPGGKIAKGALRGAKGLGSLGWRGLKGGLGLSGEALKAAGAARAAGKAGFVGTAEAFKAARGIKAQQEFTEAYHALLESGVTHDEAMAALTREAPKGPGMLRRILGGAGKGALAAGRAGGRGLGALWRANAAGNRMTASAAGGLLKGGARLAGRGLLAGAKAAPGALMATGKFLGGKALPWVAKDVGKNALRFAKFGGGLGLGLGLDAASHFANASGHTTIGKGLDYASDAVTGFGLAGTAAGLMGIEGGALGLGGAILGAIGAPVLIGGALLAGAGYLAYKGYKYLKETKLTRLSKLRYIQYGFGEKDDEHARGVFQLEGMLEPHVTFGANGVPQINPKGIKEEDLLSPFGVDKDNKLQVQNWLKWFTQRFKPVFLIHMGAIHKVDPKVKLGGIEDMKANQKKTYLSFASWPGGPYKYPTSPFPDLEALPSGPEQVADYAKRVKEITDAQVTNAPASEKDAIKPANAPKTVAEIAAAAKTAQAVGGAGDQTSWNTITKNDGSVDTAGIGTTGAIISMKGSFDAAHIDESATLDGLSVIRMKSYGLQEMNISKVKQLLTLEMTVQKDIKVGPDGSAQFTGNLAVLFNACAPAFGVQAPNSREGTNWLGWFRGRFLPVYLNYVTGLAKATKINDPRGAVAALKPSQALEIAGTIRSTSGAAGSIWKQSQSPWPDYALNNDVKSTDANYNALEEKAKQKNLQEAQAKKKDEPTSWVGKAWKSLTTDSHGNRNTLGKISDAVVGAAKSAGSAIVNTVRAVNNVTVGAATAGAYGAGQGASIQKETADSKKVKASLMKAATAAGITNPNELAMFMAQMDVESGGFKSLSENLNYKPDRLRSVFSKYFINEADAATVAQGGPQAIADRVYGNRMGNNQAGDGYKYRGRGVIQLTGKENYARYGKLVGLDLVGNPDLASDPDNAAKIAVAFWKDKGLSQAAQQGDVKAVTRVINGGQNGLSDREAKFKQYLQQAQNGQLASQAGGEALTTGDKGAGAGKPGTPPAGPTGGVGGAPAAAAAGSSGTGAPAGFGGSSPPTSAGGSINTPKTAFDNLGGAGKPASKPATAPPTMTRSAPTDPFAMPTGTSSMPGSGFGGQPRASDQIANRQANVSPAGVAVPADGGIASQQLQVSRDMLTALQTLVKIASNGSSLGTGGSAANQSDMQQTIASRKNDNRRQAPAQAAMVSLDKPNFS